MCNAFRVLSDYSTVNYLFDDAPIGILVRKSPSVRMLDRSADHVGNHLEPTASSLANPTNAKTGVRSVERYCGCLVRRTRSVVRGRDSPLEASSHPPPIPPLILSSHHPSRLPSRLPFPLSSVSSPWIAYLHTQWKSQSTNSLLYQLSFLSG